MRQAQQDWAETARDTWTHWECSQGDQKSAGRAWKTLSLREKAALTPEAMPGEGKGRSLCKSQRQKPALAFPGLYLFLVGVMPSLPLKRGKESPNTQSGDTVGVEGLWGSEAPGGSRPSSALSSVPELRTQLRRLHPGLPWQAPRHRQLVTQTQVMTSGTSVPWDSPQARSLLSPLPFLPHQRVSGCLSDSDSEKRQGAAEDLFQREAWPLQACQLTYSVQVGPGQMRPGPVPSCPSLCLPTPQNLGSLISWLFSPFLKGRIFTIAMRSSMVMGMLSLLCECPLTRETFMLQFYF